MNCLTVIQLKLKTFFRKLGMLIGKHPKLTIASSVIISLLLALGTFRIAYITDFDALMAPLGCRVYAEERALKSLFPMNTSSNFDVYRAINRGNLGTIIFLAKDGGNMLRESIFSEISDLDSLVQSFTIEYKGETYKYSKVCAKNHDTCWTNDIMYLSNKIRQIESKTFFIRYPFELNLTAVTLNVTAINLGGVTTDTNDNVLEAKAIRLFYFLDNSTPEKEIIAIKWEEEFLNTVYKYKSNLTIIHRFAGLTFNVEVWKFVTATLELGWVSVMVIVIFSVVSSMTSNWVRSKPWLAVCGCISVALAIISSFGILILLGLECVPTNIAVPFLIMGIGVDDMFILIAAWRRTKPQDNTIERMGESYSKAAMSITMTSLTNFISFFIGMTTPFPALRIFCIYSAVAVVFDFIYQITFFGACMALDGERERRHLHPITFRPVKIVGERSDQGRLYKLLFTDKSETLEAQPPQLMIWCRDILGHWIGQTPVKIAIFVVLLIYLFGAGWNLTMLREGINHGDIFPYDSYASPYAINYYRYFTQYPHQIQVVINTTLDYSNPSVQKKVLATLDRFHKSPFIYKMEMNWLKYYLDFLNNENLWAYRTAYNTSNPKDFIRCLREVYFRYPLSKMFEQDIIFDEDDEHIVASRFVLFTKNIRGSINEKDMVMGIRSIADSSPLPVIVQNMWWINYEQLLILRSVTLQSVSAAVGATLLVFFLFLPSLSSVVCVALTIVSIEFGTVGYMAAFNMTLNSISAVILVMSIGFCIDYSAHISYSYTSAEGTHQERVKQSLFAAAMPIMQGTLSSMFGAITLSLIPSFMLKSFCKIIFLIISIAFLHAIFVLPTLLSLWDIVGLYCSRIKRKSKLSNPEQQLT